MLRLGDTRKRPCTAIHNADEGSRFPFPPCFDIIEALAQRQNFGLSEKIACYEGPLKPPQDRL
jgi:hypothetical protein